ncbi:MAG TPA: UPF0182 family protein, partial [Candidatus Eisenbacteria bacterium]
LEAEWGWGIAFGSATLLFTALNLWWARRAVSRGSRLPGFGGKVAAGLVLFFAAQAGFGFGARHWPAILLWQHRQPFGLVEPIFGKDAGFYVFTLPLAERIGGWALAILFLNAIAVTISYLTGAAGGLGLAPTGIPGQWKVVRRDPVVSATTHWNRLLTHLSILGVLVFLVFAAQAQLAAWGMMFSAQGVVHGPGWTDVHVRLPAYRILIGALVLGALLFVRAAVAHTLKSTVQAILAGVGLAAVVWLVGLNFLPGLNQRYRVSPNEPTLETPFMRHNMGFTRHAFGLTDDDVETRDFPQIVPPRAETLVTDSLTLANMRLWDWRALESTYDQNQSFRQYYDFYDVDIDRYRVGGATSQVMLALREMNQGAFSENAVTWVNLRMVYTHGYGLCLNPTNEFTPEGLPNYWVRDIPPVSTHPALAITRPEIYYGELTKGPVYVKTGQKEFNYPEGDQNAYTTYEGTGGIRLGSGLRRLALALRLDGIRQLTSADLTAESRLMLRRQVHERVRALAPFLRLDEDPYAVIIDGRLGIVFDGYTVSDHFPYSERLQGGLNYIRNSVKILVDCYDGSVTLYAVDEVDPVLKAWRAAFPTLFQPASAMPAGLRAHLRYPEDLLNLQAHVYGTYHMTDPMVFYNKEDRWAVALESIGQNQPQEMLPYYAVLRLPGESTTEFVQLIPFTPFTARGAPRNNMIGWMAGRCDGEHYGKLLVYRFPKQSLVYGPMQIEARIDQDAVIAKDLTLWNQQGSNVIRGNLLVVPLENGLLYTKPIFLQATHSRMPELKRVVVASQERLGYGASYAEALADLIEQPLPGSLYRAVTGRWPEGVVTPAIADSGAVALPGGISAMPMDRANLVEARRLYRRYLELMGAGRAGEAGAVLEELGRTLGSRAGSAEN